MKTLILLDSLTATKLDGFETETLELMGCNSKPGADWVENLLYDYAAHLLMSRRFAGLGNFARARDYERVCDRIRDRLPQWAR